MSIAPLWDVDYVAPGMPSVTRQTIDKIDRELAATRRLHADMYCLTCNQQGCFRAHYLPDGKVT